MLLIGEYSASLTQNSEPCGCHGAPGLIDTCTGVGSAVRLADSRHRQRLVFVQPLVDVLLPVGDVPFLEQIYNRHSRHKRKKMLKGDGQVTSDLCVGVCPGDAVIVVGITG